VAAQIWAERLEKVEWQAQKEKFGCVVGAGAFVETSGMQDLEVIAHSLKVQTGILVEAEGLEAGVAEAGG